MNWWEDSGRVQCTLSCNSLVRRSAKLKVGKVDFIGFYITSLAPSEVWISPVSIGITGIKKGSTKLIIQVSEAGKEPLRWEMPVMVK